MIVSQKKLMKIILHLVMKLDINAVQLMTLQPLIKQQNLVKNKMNMITKNLNVLILQDMSESFPVFSINSYQNFFFAFFKEMEVGLFLDAILL